MTTEIAWLLLLAAGMLALLLWLLTERKQDDRDDPVKVRFYPCAGDCGARVMTIGWRPMFGDVLMCAKCDAKRRQQRELL